MLYERNPLGHSRARVIARSGSMSNRGERAIPDLAERADPRLASHL